MDFSQCYCHANYIVQRYNLVKKRSNVELNLTSLRTELIALWRADRNSLLFSTASCRFDTFKGEHKAYQNKRSKSNKILLKYLNYILTLLLNLAKTSVVWVMLVKCSTPEEGSTCTRHRHRAFELPPSMLSIYLSLFKTRTEHICLLLWKRFQGTSYIYITMNIPFQSWSIWRRVNISKGDFF